ncbi:cytosolic carboxypeptidase 1 isoform X4 [Hydra vulgaris]|uniref:Cytosolic carboxypeptidase 1 isoform X4 n=1 Tax=Hydra vulgaris TaxID=6087 RepID=A0ABM4BR90_HYDVU
MNQVEPKRHLFNHVFSQLSCEWEELQKENTTSCAQMKTLSGKLLKLLSSSDLYRRELLQKQENIKVLFQIVEVFCTKDQQITQNILESVYLACSPDSRVSCLAEVGLLSLLFNCLNKVAANVSILQNNILSIDTLALCHALIAKLALKEKKFATICRLSGALKSTILLLKLSTSDKMNLVSVDVLRLNATSSVNCTLMIKEGIVTILQSIILSCGHRKCQILKKSLDLLSTICKLENGVKKAIRTGLMKQLLNIYKSWHKWDLKNSHVAVRKSVLHSIIACLMFPIGSKAFIDEEGFKTIYLLGLEQLDRPDTDVLIKASILILRKCFVQKIPLRSLWSLYNFPLPQSSHFVETENFLPVLTVNGDEIEEENVYKDTHVNISIYDYMNFMPELKENKELHSQHNVHKQKYSGKDLDEEIKQYKIFEDFQRIIFPDTIINRTVFDLDELTHETYLSSNSADCENESLKPDKYIGNLKPNLKTHSSLRSLSGPIQLEMIKKDPLIFESRFESGNLRKAIQVRSYEYDLLLNADINTSGHHQWFYFQISNMEPNVSYRFNIINCEKANSQFNFGMQPLLYSMRLSQRGQGWIRAGTNICYYKNFYVKDLSSHKHYHTATFTISFPHAKDTCYLAYHYPYTYSLLKNHLQHIKDFLSPSIFYCQQVLCSSLAGNKVPLVTITSKEIDEKEKVYVFLTARVHPGETNSSWIMKGILDFLTSNSEEACSLRSAVVFKIVPMLNPDGVINGCHRCSLSGQDLNRKWKQPDAVLHPSIYHTKSFLKYLASIDKKPEIFVDFHGHSRKKNIFMYGCRDVSLSESLSSLQLNSKCSNSMCHDIELLPKILSQETPCFSLSQCNFLVDKSKESTARVVCYSEIGIRKSYTMESTYCGMDQGTYKGHHIGTDRLERMGRDFCLALEKFFVLSDVI